MRTITLSTVTSVAICALSALLACDHVDQGGDTQFGDINRAIGEDCDRPDECESGLCSDGICVECLKHSDCRNDSVVRVGSTLGLCTPDKTCTCWIDGEDDDTWSCKKQSDCPDGLVCAKERNMMMHHACLAPCDAEQEPRNGFGCAHRRLVDSDDKALLWGPMTSCYAFEMFGRPCGSDPLKCRAVANISPWFEDGYCLVDTTERCSYFCNDLESVNTDMDSWCPDGYTCVNKVCEAAEPNRVRAS